MSENLKRLEEKIAFLERHVSEQDKVMLELGDELARLRREVKMLRDRTPSGGSAGTPGDEAEERPPHY
ncbi:MAG TPA: SlyX family protein [Opitutaceae bacterium]|nr:SlyX family protein [Opitutaceae bacterium]